MEKTMFENEIESIWQEEDPYMEDFSEAMERNPQCDVFRKPRSVHFLKIWELRQK